MCCKSLKKQGKEMRDCKTFGEHRRFFIGLSGFRMIGKMNCYEERKYVIIPPLCVLSVSLEFEDPLVAARTKMIHQK